MPPQKTGPTPGQKFRYPDDRWQEFLAAAGRDGRDGSEVLRAFCEAYIDGRLRLTADGRVTTRAATRAA